MKHLEYWKTMKNDIKTYVLISILGDLTILSPVVDKFRKIYNSKIQIQNLDWYIEENMVEFRWNSVLEIDSKQFIDKLLIFFKDNNLEHLIDLRLEWEFLDKDSYGRYEDELSKIDIQNLEI